MRRRTSGNKNNQQPTRSSREERRTSVERTNRSRVRPHRLAWPTLRLFLVPPHDRTPPTTQQRPRTNVPTTTTKEVCCSDGSAECQRTRAGRAKGSPTTHRRRNLFRWRKAKKLRVDGPLSMMLSSSSSRSLLSLTRKVTLDSAKRSMTVLSKKSAEEYQQMVGEHEQGIDYGSEAFSSSVY